MFMFCPILAVTKGNPQESIGYKLGKKKKKKYLKLSVQQQNNK